MNKNESLEEAAYQHIKNKIIQREIFHGSRILQETIVQETGISRTPVYQAILRLKHEGYVDFLPKRGAAVIKPTAKDIHDAYDFRVLLETNLIRRVCHVITKDRIDEMEHYVNEQSRLYATGNIQVFNDLNRKFHLTLCAQEDNKYYEKVLHELYNKCDIYLLFYDRYKMQKPEESSTLRAHRKIISALRERDEEACVRLMKEHIEITRNHLDL